MSNQQFAALKVVEVIQAASDSALRGQHVDRPLPGKVADEFEVVGWVIPVATSVRRVRVTADEATLAETNLNHLRPDLKAAYPDVREAEESGFRVLVAPGRVPSAELIEVKVDLADGSSVHIGSLRLSQDIDAARGERTEGARSASQQTSLGQAKAERRRRGWFRRNPRSAHPVAFDISGEEANRRFKESSVAWWSSGWEREPEPHTAWHRLQEPLFIPDIMPGFTISPRDKIFAIGSCFARGVEGRLAAMGYDVVSRTNLFDEFQMKRHGWPHDFTNKYNVPSILNELRWVLGGGTGLPDDALYKVEHDQWHDAHANPVFGLVTKETAVRQHQTLSRLVSKITECRVVIITLGLIEAWFDTKLGLYTNATPWRSGVSLERYRFRVLTFGQIEDALSEIHELLTEHGHEGLRIVVTVSPVPLEATFTGSDIVIANTHSKALLRAAAAEWASANANVDYFPSYEIAMNSSRSRTWHMDGRHVRKEAVAHIMDTFVANYVEGGLPVQDRPAVVSAV